MRAPFDFQHHVVQRNSSFILLVAHALIDEALHTFDEFGSGEPAAWVHSAAEPAVDDAAHCLRGRAEGGVRVVLPRASSLQSAHP